MWYYRNSMIEWNYYRVALSNEEHIYDGVALRQNMIQNKKVCEKIIIESVIISQTEIL